MHSMKSLCDAKILKEDIINRICNLIYEKCTNKQLAPEFKLNKIFSGQQKGSVKFQELKQKVPQQINIPNFLKQQLFNNFYNNQQQQIYQPLNENSADAESAKITENLQSSKFQQNEIYL